MEATLLLKRRTFWNIYEQFRLGHCQVKKRLNIGQRLLRLTSARTTKFLCWVCQISKTPTLRSGAFGLKDTLNTYATGQFWLVGLWAVCFWLNICQKNRLRSQPSDFSSWQHHAVSIVLKNLSKHIKNIEIWHSEDDFVVDFTDAKKYQKALPEATFKGFIDKNHFLTPTFPELLQSIKIAT